MKKPATLKIFIDLVGHGNLILEKKCKPQVLGMEKCNLSIIVLFPRGVKFRHVSMYII